MVNTNYKKVIERLKEYISMRIASQDGTLPGDHMRIKCLDSIRCRLDELIKEYTDEED